jgi:hypothetical protein
MRFLTNVSYVLMLFSNLALPTTATDFELYANGSGGGICASGKAVTQEECFDAAHEVGVGMNLKDFLNVGTWDTTPCGCFIYIDHWVDYKDPASANCLEADVNSNLVCRKEAPPAINAPSETPTTYRSDIPSETPTDNPSQIPISWQPMGGDINGEAKSEYSGCSVSLSSDGYTVAIGATGNDVNGSRSGHTRVYRWYCSNSTWLQLGDDIDGEVAEDQSGGSVSLSSNGDVVAIGALYNDENGDSSGLVRVYTLDSLNSNWHQMGDEFDGEAVYDNSGYSVSLSSDGGTAAIGAIGYDANGKNSGHTRVYRWCSTILTWHRMGDDLDGEAVDDQSGRSVSLSSNGNVVAIGAIGNDGNGTFSGHTRVYKWDSFDLTWHQMGGDLDGEAAFDRSGGSVSLSSNGTIVAIGAYGNDENGDYSGHARVYTWDSSNLTWLQMGDDLDGEAVYDESGRSVSLSSNGNVVAIGAAGNDGNGTSSGHTRVYKWDSSDLTWHQMGGDINGEVAALSSDGDTVAIGATGNNGNGYDSGHVRVYSVRAA